MVEARCDCFKNKVGSLGGKLEWGLKAENVSFWGCSWDSQ